MAESRTHRTAIDRVSSRPDFVVLGYRWLDAVEKNETGVLSYCSALKTRPTVAPTSSNTHRTSMSSLRLHRPSSITRRMVSCTGRSKHEILSSTPNGRVPVEMHLFGHGRHGSGLGLG